MSYAGHSSQLLTAGAGRMLRMQWNWDRTSLEIPSSKRGLKIEDVVVRMVCDRR